MRQEDISDTYTKTGICYIGKKAWTVKTVGIMGPGNKVRTPEERLAAFMRPLGYEMVREGEEEHG